MTDTLAQEVERREALATSFGPAGGPVQPTRTCAASFTLAQPVLLQMLTTVMKTIPPTRYGLDILKHVQIQVETDRIVLRGTDLSTGIELVVPAAVSRTGMYTIHAKTLLDSVKTFPKTGMVELEVKNEHVNVTCGKRTFSLKDVTDGKDFPCLPEVQADYPYIIASEALREATHEVAYAAGDPDGQHPVYQAVCLHLVDSCMNLVALNGERMAIRQLSSEHSQGWNASVLVPDTSLQILCDVMPKNEEVWIGWNTQHAIFHAGHLRLVTRLVEGTYPKYRAALPESSLSTFTISRTALVSLLNAFRPYTRDSSNLLKLSYTSGEVTFAARSHELGEVHEGIDATISGEEDYAYFDANYIADVLKHVAVDAFTFAVSGYGYPCLMTPVGRNDYLALIMPMSCDQW